MDAALIKCDTDWKQIETEGEAPRKSATFTEIYELIFYNQTMMPSELGVLLQLIRKKLMEKAGETSAFTVSDGSGACGKKNVEDGIRPVLK